MYQTAFYIVAALLIAVGSLVIVSRYFLLWLQATVTGTRSGLLSLMLMSLRKVDPNIIVQCKVMAVQAGLPHISTDAIEAQYLRAKSTSHGAVGLRYPRLTEMTLPSPNLGPQRSAL